MTGSRGSPLSIPGRYRCSYPIIFPCERGDDTYSGVCYSYTLREIVAACLMVISNCEISKITVHAYGGDAFNYGRISGDTEVQSVPREGEGANLGSLLRYDL